MAGGIGGDGESRWEYFRNVVAVPSIKKTGGALRCGYVPCMRCLSLLNILLPPSHVSRTSSSSRTTTQIVLSENCLDVSRPECVAFLAVLASAASTLKA